MIAVKLSALTQASRTTLTTSKGVQLNSPQLLMLDGLLLLTKNCRIQEDKNNRKG